jgi:(S)-ureidoglycine aminohydrolase
LQDKAKEDFMLYDLGQTRSSLKADHLLHTLDTFIRTPLPGAHKVEFIVHTALQLRAAFTQMTAEFAPGGGLGPPAAGIQRFLYVLDGSLEFSAGFASRLLLPSHFAYVPANTPHQVRAPKPSRVVLIEKPYQPLPDPIPTPEIVFGDEASVPSEALGGDSGLQVRHLMPDGPTWDFAVNTMTYDPGAALAQVEVHIMEHGLLMLEGGGIYRLGDNWYPVTAGDFIWMAPYCPQWFGALGKTPAKYLIYKDWYRHPLGA